MTDPAIPERRALRVDHAKLARKAALEHIDSLRKACAACAQRDGAMCGPSGRSVEAMVFSSDKCPSGHWVSARTAGADFIKAGEELTEPTRVEMLENAVTAAARWARAGFKTVSTEQAAARDDACNSCEHWDADARLGLGKCNRCGCTMLKWWLATEICPVGKWPSVR
jgi:hypothetical protein